MPAHRANSIDACRPAPMSEPCGPLAGLRKRIMINSEQQPTPRGRFMTPEPRTRFSGRGRGCRRFAADWASRGFRALTIADIFLMLADNQASQAAALVRRIAQ